MATDSNLRVIRDRRAKNAITVSRLEVELAALRIDQDRLRIAEEVLVSILGGTVEAQDHKGRSRRKGKGRAPRAKSPPKPAGIPETPIMILEALGAARQTGVYRLRPEEITTFVREKYWPGVQSEAVGPTAWRMWKDGRLSKDDSGYFLKNETPAAETAGASKSGPEVNGADHSPSPADNGRSPGELFSGQSGRA